jgi:hypothetical protein
VAATLLLSGCGDTSATFELPDGCYYANDGTPILRVRREEGLILTPDPTPNPGGYTYIPVRHVQLRPRANRDGAYIEVTPGFYLTDTHGAAKSGEPTGRFIVNIQASPPVIMVPTEAYGAIPVRPGMPCEHGIPPSNRP